VGAGTIGTPGVLLALEPCSQKARTEQVDLLRWDLFQIVSGVVVPGWTDVARDAAGDTLSMTGFGQASPEKRKATGRGTFVHRLAKRSDFAHGIYYVTRFNSFVNAGGSLAGIGPSTASVASTAPPAGCCR